MNGKEIVCANHLNSNGSDGVDATDANRLPQSAPEKTMAPGWRTRPRTWRWRGCFWIVSIQTLKA